MRISELSRRSGVTVPTIKYYLREGLLPRGTRTARNQADYASDHVERLRVIRTLVEVGGLDLKSVATVIGAIDDTGSSLHETIGVAHYALGPAAAPDGDSERAGTRAEIDRFVADLGWRVAPGAPGRRMLADALDALRRLGYEVGPEVFARHAEVAHDLAAWEVDHLPADSAAELVRSVVVGTVIFEAALIALRRLAQEHHSALKFGGRADGRRPGLDEKE